VQLICAEDAGKLPDEKKKHLRRIGTMVRRELQRTGGRYRGHSKNAWRFACCYCRVGRLRLKTEIELIGRVGRRRVGLRRQ